MSEQSSLLSLVQCLCSQLSLNLNFTLVLLNLFPCFLFLSPLFTPTQETLGKNTQLFQMLAMTNVKAKSELMRVKLLIINIWLI